MFGLGNKGGTVRKQTARAPRTQMSCTATIVAENRFFRANLLDISHSGCRVHLTHGIRPQGDRVQIAFEAFHSLGGTIRWFKDSEMGIKFTTPLSDHLLLRWSAELEREQGRFKPEMKRRRKWRDFWG